MKEELSPESVGEQKNDDLTRYAPPAPEPEAVNEAPAKELAAAFPVAVPAVEEAPAVAAPKEPAKEKDPEEKAVPVRKRGMMASLFDAVLVLLVVAVVGVAGYVVYEMRKAYPVETTVDKLRAENSKLSAHRETLKEAFLKSQEDARSLQEYTNTVDRLLVHPRSLQNIVQRIKDLDVAISLERNALRSLDAEYRQLAQTRMSGLLIDSLTTVDGRRSYQGVIIKKFDGKDLSIAHTEGLARIPLANLPMERLPLIVRYALGGEDPLNIAELDKEAAGSSSSTKDDGSSSLNVRKHGGESTEPSVRREVMAQLTPSAYDPPAAKPTVDVNSPATMPAVAPSVPRNSGSGWVAPDDPLPLNM